MHANAFPIEELSFTGSGNLGNPIYSLQKNVLQFTSRETETPALTATGITSFASQVAIEFVNWQSNLSKEGNSILDEGPEGVSLRKGCSWKSWWKAGLSSHKCFILQCRMSSQPASLHLFPRWRSVLDEIAKTAVKDLLCHFSLSSFTDVCSDPPVCSLTPCPVDISVMQKRPSLFHKRILVLQMTEVELERRAFSGVCLASPRWEQLFMAYL